MKKINAFDIETIVNNEKKLIPYCICYTDNNEYKSLYGLDCIKKFINFLMTQNDKIYYAHNLTFDGSFIIKELANASIDFILFLSKNHIYYIKIKKNNIELKCSYMLFPYSLHKAQKILKCNTKLPFSVKEINFDNFENMNIKKQVIDYCINDVKLVMELLHIYDVCISPVYPNWRSKNSISSITLSLFNKKFNTEHIKTELSFTDDCIFRKAYFGGRCEIFGNPYNDDHIYHFDFKGMYSQIMYEDFPIGNYSYIDYKGINTVSIKDIGFYFVTIHSDMEIPILPFRSEDGKLIFPNGSFSGLYWYEELNYFVIRGGIIKEIHYAYTFKKKKKVFKLYTEKMSELRNLNEWNNFVFKQIINSLYGRLGMSFKNEETIISDKKNFSKIELTHEVIKYSIIGEIYLVTIKKEVNMEEIIKSNVIYASIITSKARIKLHKGFIKVMENNGRLLYTDTDSIFASFKKNVDDEKHGEIFWDVTKKDTKITDAVFALPKTYALEYPDKTYKIKMKGLKHPNITFNEFKDKFYTGSNFYTAEECLLNRNLEFNETNILKLINFDSKNYTKRIFSKDLKTTEPINLD
jgi:ribosomal protein L14